MNPHSYKQIYMSHNVILNNNMLSFVNENNFKFYID